MLSGMLVAFAIAGILLATVAAIYLLSLRSFHSFQNNIDMESQGRLACDRLGEQIRAASRIVQFKDGKLVLRVGTNDVEFRYDNAARTLDWRSHAERQTLLSDCDYVRYEFFARAQTNAGFGLLPAAGATNANAVMVSWRCTRFIQGKPANVLERETPRFVMRKSLL